jgi:soluble lytic murein transglycosylase-like protein
VNGRALFLVALVVLLLAGGGTVVVAKLSEEQKRVRLAARRQAPRFGVNPEILEALGYVESRWRTGATNLSGTDGARGGAWGPFQLTEKTARAYGFTRPMVDLTTDADLAAEWASRILAARPGGAPRTVEDAAAWWNAGKTSAAALGPTHVTRRDYFPKALAALAVVRANPVSVA